MFASRLLVAVVLIVGTFAVMLCEAFGAVRSKSMKDRPASCRCRVG